MRYGKSVSRVNVLEFRYLRRLVGASRVDRVRNEEVRRRAGIERQFASKVDQRVFIWFDTLRECS